MKAAYLKYIVALVMLGSNGCFASLMTLSSHEIVFTRCALGSLTMLAVFLLTRKKAMFPQHRRQAAFLVLAGVALAGNWLCMYEGYARIGVSVTTLLTYLGPVLVMAVSPIIFKERLKPVCVICFAAVFAGVVLLNGFAPEGSLDPVGLAFGFGAALTYMALIAFSKQAKDIVGIENSLIQTASALVVVTVYVLAKQGALPSPAPSDIAPMLVLGVVNTGIGVFLYFSGINKLPAQSVAVIGYLEPLSAVLLSAVFLSEVLSGMQVLGAALILGGAVCCELAQRKGR